ncbi:hypothetical protein B0H10DRAFT_2066309 [Mycena sp. CBHHK59/15]|nr:hypothetical protein B0H10DRAFT_2066309 [Mycena sp. CBHHK59/15]
MAASPLGLSICVCLAILPLVSAYLRRPRRSVTVPSSEERIVILGASTGIGRTLAQEYALSGVKAICVCQMMCTPNTDIVGVTGDFAEVDDMVKLRARLESLWGGIDTLVVAAGVSTLRPLMAVAGVDVKKGEKMPDATKQGIEKAVYVTSMATRGNYVGPLVSAITFIPLLTNSSKAPAILLISSLASVIPAPTRSLYASTKSAALLLYQALAIEHPEIAFSLVLPSTVEGDFRASAVDGGNAREADPNKHGLKREAVARRCMEAIERREKNVFIPWGMGPAHMLYWLWPAFLEWRARVKYNFS